MAKYQELRIKAEEFQLNVEDAAFSVDAFQPKIDPEDDICVNQTEVEHLVHTSLNHVMRNSMDVHTAMKTLIDDYNTNLKESRKNKPTNDPQRMEISYDVLEEVPTFQIPSTVMQSVNHKQNTFKEFMNVPMVPYIIKALDEGVETIAGYNESLARMIDFIAGLTASNREDGSGGGYEYEYGRHREEEDEGSVGKTIESGLLRFLNKFDVPQKLTNMNQKAGILSRS